MLKSFFTKVSSEIRDFIPTKLVDGYRQILCYNDSEYPFMRASTQALVWETRQSLLCITIEFKDGGKLRIDRETAEKIYDLLGPNVDAE